MYMMRSIMVLMTVLLHLYFILDYEGVSSQTCPTECSDCKYNPKNQLTAATCVNVRLLHVHLPNSLIHLTIKDLSNPIFNMPNGDFRDFYIRGKGELLSLTIENYGIRALNSQCFKNSPKLKTLSLKRNLLQSLTEDNFQGLVNLEYLDLSQNKMQNLSDFVFRQLIMLKDLEILMNEISYVGENVFKGLTSIERIDLQSNHISSIQKDAFKGLTSLKDINLLSNRLTRIETGTFSNLNNLTAINLRNNQLVYLDPDSMTGLPALIELNLAQNHLRTVSSLFLQKTSNLQLEINLSRNNLTILTNGYLTNVLLKALYLVGNMISLVEPAAIKDSFIQKLDLQQNQLHHFPGGIQKYINQSTVILLANNPWTCDCDIYWMASILTNQMQDPVCAEPVNYKGWTVSYFSRNVSMACYFGSLPVPTKVFPQPPKQGIVTPALGTKATSEQKPSNQTNKPTHITTTDKGENNVPFIAGGVSGLLFLIFTILSIYLYTKHMKAKVDCENLKYCNRVDYNSKTKFSKHNIQPLIDA